MSAGNVCVAAERLARNRLDSGFPPRRGIAEDLSRIVKCFAVHVFMKHREFGEVAQCFVVRLAFQSPQDAFEHIRQIALCRLDIGQRQIPTCPMGHSRGVVEHVGVCENRWQEFFVGVANTQTPIFLEPAEVADFPKWRI